MDSDRVLVMADGRVAEFAPPGRLLTNQDSLFYKLVHRQWNSKRVFEYKGVNILLHIYLILFYIKINVIVIIMIIEGLYVYWFLLWNISSVIKYLWLYWVNQVLQIKK